MSTILTQEHINRLSNLGSERAKSQEFLYERLIQNHLVQDLIADLSEDLDE